MRVAVEGQREAFTALAAEALDANSRRLMDLLEGSGKRLTEASAAQMEANRAAMDASRTLIGQQMDGKKALIDQSLLAVNERLEMVRQFVGRIEADRKQDFGRLAGAVTQLSQTTGELHKMLASTQRRGAWGERMAQDVLRLAGMEENINYVRQSTEDAENGRADFTFMLPNDLKVNMDVKFPLEKYKAYLDSDSDAGRAQCAKDLCAAVRGHIRAVAGRGYIDPSVPTVPYVIMFIPSEQIFSLVLSCEPDLMDEALSKKVVMASPLTLYAKLAIMRQAAENFNVMKTAGEIVALVGQFRKQWQVYNEELDKLGKRIEQVSEQFGTVRVTRSNMLQRPMDKIEELQQSRKLPAE
jgi:DNA recombination protein RmuC